MTLTDIAAAVGMHKSAMLRYFETRDHRRGPAGAAGGAHEEIAAAVARPWT
ncbi:hypothetical protein [Streptomyces sp. NPDC048282]|uniref:hypothetical protein n=1 Tax=Streptomyces sp. NPDC048282 TaxID=3365528 RepID=UPI003710A461